MIDRGLDRVDPMSPDFDDKVDVELKKDELDGDEKKQSMGLKL
jgi:hypothetical protein